MKHAHVNHNGIPTWGFVEGDEIKLENGIVIHVDEADYLPVTNPSKVLAPHLTYRSRCVEYKMTRIPEEPHFFMMPSTAVSHHGATVARPRGTKFLNYEGEVAVVIGQTCSNVTPEEALEYVKGYTIANDFGLHDLRHVDRGAMTRVKGIDGYCPIGPFLVDTTDLDQNNLELRTYVNGQVVQEANTGDDLMFSIAYQVADLARFITLLPGDLVLTGTPANSRPVQPGDVVEVEVSSIGRLSNTIVEMDHDLVKVGFQPEVTPNTLHVALAMPEDEAEVKVSDYQS
ncbi:fumarylacetoacetate hydrolase family protein [Chloroflexi bacterium TSY]|nr:fumarylacetoacetate hydrolase family protein [Chloroflexi bacterium TSY]